MSVLIKEMKFPKNCEDCPLGEESDSLYYSCYPQGLDYTHDSKSGRMPNCPLIEVPPHGRLIEEPKAFDLGGLFYIEPHDFERIGEYFADQVKEQPTIIEKEDGT